MARPVGVKETKPRNTAARKQADDFRQSGMTILDGLKMAAEEAFEDWQKQDRDSQGRAACRAQYVAILEKTAPYCHAKLASTVINATVRTLRDLTTDELIALAGADDGADGIAETGDGDG